MEHKYITEAVKTAVAAERERCAKIAEGFGVLDGVEDQSVYRAKTVGYAIATSIRNEIAVKNG